MKRTKFIYGTLLVLVAAGCSDEIDTRGKMPVSGEEIAFGTHLQDFEKPNATTRTIYGVPDNESVESYSELTIKWVEGDQVRVYSPQASEGFQSADYTIAETNTGDNASKFYLVKNGETGVRWGNASDTHHFYAFYPTNIGRDDKSQPIEGLQTSPIVQATIPVAQEHGELFTWENPPSNVTLDKGWKLIRPDMTYAMMAGHGIWTPSTNDNTVTLNFKPLVTVVDVVINGPKDGETPMDVYFVSIRSKTQPIVGDFTCKINENGTVEFSNMEETVTSDNNIATINCQYKDKETGMNTPVKLSSGEKLTLKFFLLPRKIQASDLSVSVHVNSGRILTQNLVPEGSNLDRPLAQGEIVRVVTPNLKMPETSNWMSLIGDNVLFTQLSLPGSKYSYTGDLYKDSNHNFNEDSDIMQFYQSLNVADNNSQTNEETQFDKGIRAFEAKIKPNNGIYNIYAGGKEVGNLTLKSVLNTFKRKLNASDKEAIVFFLGYVDPPQDYRDWVNGVASEIDDWAKTNKDILKRINASTTMDDMRGKIAIVMNIPGDYPPSSQNVNYILNYNTSAESKIVSGQLNSSLPLYMQSGERMNNPRITSDPNTYAIHGDDGLIPYFLDKKIKYEEAISGDLLGEKYNMMLELFNQMRKGQDGLYLNDLGGFCVVKHKDSVGWVDGKVKTKKKYRWESSSLFTRTYYICPEVDYYGGTEPDAEIGETWFDIENDKSIMGQGGNTIVFAQEFNKLASDALYDMVNQGRVPLGVVLLNFAGENQVEMNGQNYEVYGETLPSLIMSNNFMFPLETIDNGN